MHSMLSVLIYTLTNQGGVFLNTCYVSEKYIIPCPLLVNILDLPSVTALS